MFHLFKKVYIDFDDKINMSYDRIICSNEFGKKADAADLSRVFYGELIATSKSIDDLIGRNKSFETLIELFEELNTRVDNTDSPVYIYCDRESYIRFVAKWLRVLLPFCDAVHGWKFLKSHIFKEKNFVNSRLSASESFCKDINKWTMLEVEFKHYWDQEALITSERLKYTPFLEKVKTSLRVEFLLAGYLYDKRYGDILAQCITPLIKKDLEKFLNEHKEIILVHFQRPIFQQLLEVQNGPYTFDNFYDMMDDPAPLVQLMFNPEIWGEDRSSMFAESSKGNINFSGFTDEDIENLKKYSVIVGKIWSDEEWYMTLRSETDKFEFIKMLRNKDYFTVEDLDEIINYEIFHQHHAAGSFYAIDLRTVNTYFIDHILMNHEDKSKLRPYVFEMPT
jgi:hypothetical protein